MMTLNSVRSTHNRQRTMTPTTIICIGMAGAGKTTFVQRLNSHLKSQEAKPYVINLDPAVLKTPYEPNIDIRDSINYKRVMEKYNLGPNGAIVTSLNLFSTKIDQVINLVEKRADEIKSIVIDTPGQIECFVWSASGSILTEAFASAFPTIIAYIVDTPRTAAPSTFMSNMLYACSILYKTKLPMIVVFNKTDVKDASFAEKWMRDFESFQEALLRERTNDKDGSSSGYMNSLVNSLSLTLEEFYSQLDVVSCSAYTGDGLDDFFDIVEKKTHDYTNFYLAERKELLNRNAENESKRKNESLNKLIKDLNIKSEQIERGRDSNVLSDFEDSDDDSQSK